MLPRAIRQPLLALAFAASFVSVLSLPAASPAVAAASVTLTPPGETVLYSGCSDYSYGYAVAAPSSDWSVDIAVTDAFGAEQGSGFVYDAEPAVGTEMLRLCGNGMHQPGTYTMTAVLTWWDSTWTKHVEPAVSSQFTLALPATATRLTASTTRPTYNKNVVFTVRSREQARIGFAPFDYTKVRLEASRSGAWRKVGVATTDTYGVARFAYRWNVRLPKVKVRAITLPTGSSRSSTSPIVVMRVR